MTTSEPPGNRGASRARLTRRLFPHGVPRLRCPTLTHFTATGQFEEPRLRCHWQHLAPYVKIVDSPSMPRRKFLSAGGGLVAAIACGPFPAVPAVVASDPPPRRRSIGLQIGVVSFVDEGTDEVLDLLQERGGVDTIYLTAFTYGRGLAERQIPGQPFPDHGKQESD